MSAIKSITIVCLCTCAFLIVSDADAKQSGQLVLDSATVERCTLRMNRDPFGLLLFHLIDADTKEPIDSVDMQFKFSDDKYSRPFNELPAHWRNPGVHSFRFSLAGYSTIDVNNIRLPEDSAVVLTIRMKKGEGTISANGQGDSLVKVVTTGLDGVFPKNQISGEIVDDATGKLVADASVYCEESGRRQSTDDSGKFVFELGITKSATINAWHPLYDSIRFAVSKEYIHTVKKVEIHFEHQRRTVDSAPPDENIDSTVLLLADLTGWSAWGIHPREETDIIFTFRVRPGDAFGPTEGWPYYQCLPFRLVREFPDKTAWLEFSSNFGILGESMDSRTNFIFLRDTAIHLGTKTLDGGTTVALSLQPDYSPRGLMKRPGDLPRNGSIGRPSPRVIDSCDVIKAQVERTHIRNTLALLDRDFDRFADGFSPTYQMPENTMHLPLAEFFRRGFEKEQDDTYPDRRFLELFGLYAEEISIYDACSEEPNERFIKACKRGRFIPQKGDVYIYWPEGSLGWPGGSAAVYRNENGAWKIVAAL